VVTVSDGRLTVANGNGAINNKINFIEVVSLEIGGGTPPILSANFNTGTDGFTYADNTFRNANNAAYASGARLSTGGSSGTGGLQVLLGGVDSSTRTLMSGGWKRTFSLAQGATITLNFDYKMTTNNYESDEYSEVLASVDGILTGRGGNNEVARLRGPPARCRMPASVRAPCPRALFMIKAPLRAGSAIPTPSVGADPAGLLHRLRLSWGRRSISRRRRGSMARHEACFGRARRWFNEVAPDDSCHRACVRALGVRGKRRRDRFTI
jgi:hypothetical protein